MKITICGSIKFAKKLVDVHKELQKLGHEPRMHEEMFKVADGTALELKNLKNGEHTNVKRKYGFIKWWHDCIKQSDAVLICNYDKKGIKNYIGGNTLMEIGFAHVNNKKVFLLNEPPTEVPYTDEINAMVDQVINNDFNKIKL